MIRAAVSAFRTLTIIPFWGADTDRFVKALPFFPLVGVTLGMILFLVIKLLNFTGCDNFTITGLISLFVLQFLTGFLHIDGLGDVCDAFGGSGGSREKALVILKDSRMGVFGVVAILFDVLFKYLLWVAFMEKGSEIFIILSLFLGRTAMAFLALHINSAREDGLGASYSLGKENKFKILSTLWLLLAVISPIFFVYSVDYMVPTVLTFLSIVVWTLYFTKKIGGITGDILGATNELVEIFFLLFSYFFIFAG